MTSGHQVLPRAGAALELAPPHPGDPQLSMLKSTSLPVLSSETLLENPFEPLLENLLETLLETQQTLTAVERFARQHEAGEIHAPLYRDLIPLTQPKPGEQYAFEVDLDACTGCKACVAACHALNGLDDDEIWRTVGLLQGGTSAAPALATVTTSCHHCVEPACMHGCPVQAYEKDPVTGIVHHLDDQCFGCQYCTLMCPYDAPKYNRKRGIVRKCDMCSDRLAHGEAPACVDACPNGAIAIRVIEQSHAIEVSDAQRFLPGSPAPDHTIPTTRYTTRQALPANMLPADFYATRPEHSHPPLVVMLTLTQLAVGAFALTVLRERLPGAPQANTLANALFASAMALVALGASIFHLGRPHLFWRGFLGWRTSWLSREAIAFGAFAQLAVVASALTGAPLWPELPALPRLAAVAPAISLTAALCGVLGVYFSVMVYVATRREQWSGTATGIRFFGTTLILGAASVLSVDACVDSLFSTAQPATRSLLWLIAATSAVKLAFEAGLLTRVRQRHQSATKRMVLLLLGELRRITVWRFALGVVGGLVLPLWLCLARTERPPRWSTVALIVALLGCLAAAEGIERYLFFRAAPPSRMPGAIR
jgi:Fe-S-cluster-containing dehydrogenase component